MPESVERSVPDVLHDIVGNVQDILRSEFLLARTEIKEEAAAALKPAATLAAGFVLAAYAAGLLLLALVYALSKVMTPWAGALLVGASVGVMALLFIARGKHGLTRVNVKSETTIASLKENVRWATKSTK